MCDFLGDSAKLSGLNQAAYKLNLDIRKLIDSNFCSMILYNKVVRDYDYYFVNGLKSINKSFNFSPSPNSLNTYSKSSS